MDGGSRAPELIGTAAAGAEPALPGLSIRPPEPAAKPEPAPAPVSAAPAPGQAAPLLSAYPAPAATPTGAGPRGIRFDFNLGARLLLPPREQGTWIARLHDIDTGNLLFETETQGALVASAKRFFVRFRLEVLERAVAGAAPVPVFTHEYDAAGQPVLVQFPVGTLGDVLAWFPYAERFRLAHGCRLTCALSPAIAPLLRDAYPDIAFADPATVETGGFYATYSMGLFFADEDHVWQPTDFRLVGLHRTAGYILGVDPSEVAPRLALPDESRPIAEPYVCIGVQATTLSKMWNNPEGWRGVIAFLKASGYRVICIDQKPASGAGLVWTHIPHGAEDETGDRPLAERARWLRHAALFVGLSSGLSWLAWAAGAPVVLISGFTHPVNEFQTPGRVVNWHTCNSCWNDPRHRFDHADYLWCPRHAGTPRHLECTRLITAAHVEAAIRRIPAFAIPAPSSARSAA